MADKAVRKSDFAVQLSAAVILVVFVLSVFPSRVNWREVVSRLSHTTYHTRNISRNYQSLVTTATERRIVQMVNELDIDYGVAIRNPIYRPCVPRGSCVESPGEWSEYEVKTLYTTVIEIAEQMGGKEQFKALLGGISVSQSDMDYGGTSHAEYIRLHIGRRAFSEWTVAHEFGHLLNARYGGELEKGLLESTGGWIDPGMQHAVRRDLDDAYCRQNLRPGCNLSGYFYTGMPAKGANLYFNPSEDWAESFAAHIYPEKAHYFVYVMVGEIADQPVSELYYADYLQTARGQYVDCVLKYLEMPEWCGK